MDTAQPLAAETDPNVQLENAAEAFKLLDNPAASQPRGDDGKFRAKEPEQSEDEPEEAEAAEEVDDADDGEVEELEDEQEELEEAHQMPPSWPANMADAWSELPAETQSYLVEREAEQLKATQAKFQESANARKLAEAEQAEARAKISAYVEALEMVEALYQQPRPDPYAFGYGTQQFDRAAYDVAVAQYEQNASAIAQFQEQRQALAKEQQEAEQRSFAEWKQQHEAEYMPRLLSALPELKDPAKGEAVVRELISYATENGIPEDVFSESRIGELTSAELLVLHKAREFDRLKASGAKPKPKPAGPAIKPGVSSPRSAQKVARRQKAFDRLDREGSLEAGAAVFKQLGV